MSEYKIASRYAKALFDISSEKGLLDDVKKDIEHMLHLTDSNRDLEMFLESPLYKMAVKKEAIEKIFASSNEITRNLYSLMISKYREAYIPAMGRVFLKEFNKKNQIVSVEVTSAVELNKTVLEQIEAYVLENTQAKSVELTTKIDKELMGGLTVEFDGKIYDNTVVTQINKFKKELQIA
jgi:F-type H+-transporting ATPase subunit delta